MKKKYIQLGIIAFVLLALTGALLLIRNAPEVSEPEPEPAETGATIYGEIVNPRQVDIHNEYGDITIDNLAQDGTSTSELTIRGWENLSLDNYRLSQVISNAKSMRAKEIISENATTEELKTFGLDAPRASLTVHFQNDTPVILFGSNAPGGEGVYVMLENETKIYLISDTTALPFFSPATAFVNKTITATDPEFKGFEKITLSGANYPETIVIESTPEDEVEAAGITLYTHAITSPIRRGIDSQRGLEPLNSVYGLLANNVVAVDDSPEVLKKYGLDNPAAIVSVVGDTPEMTFTLKISEADEFGEIHLIKDNSKVIYELSPFVLPFLQLSLFDMMDRVVKIPNIDNIHSVTVGTEDNGYHIFEITHEDDGKKLSVTVDGKPLPDAVDEDGNTVEAGENFRKFYQTMIICRYDEPIPETETGNSTATTEPDAAATEAATSTAATTADTDVTVAESDTADNNVVTSEVDFIEPPELKSKRIGAIKYNYNNGMGSDIVYFYEGPPRKMEIRLYHIDEKPKAPIELVESGYYGQSVYLDRLYEDLEKVLNGIAVKTYL